MLHGLFKVILTSGFLCTVVLYYSDIINPSMSVLHPKRQSWQAFTKRERPLFLWWTTFHRRSNDLILLKPLQNCTFQCDFTGNKSLLKEANVVVFHGCDLQGDDMPDAEDWQIKLFLMLESPGRRNHFYNFWDQIPMNYFNTTMTYRKDSDYWLPYFTLPRLGPELPSYSEKEIDEAIKKKTKGSFSLISHCWAGSNRDGIIKEMSKYTNVSRYGKCGTRCSKECEVEAIESHHFFLAFENTICEQYVTEKFGRFKKLIVPVTLKRSLVPDFMPPDSFIAVDDFCSVEAFSNHLNYLMKNKTAYKSYFSWTKTHSYADSEATMCKVCEDLYMDRVKTRDYSQYSNIKYYFPSGQCDYSFGNRISRDRCEKSTTIRSNVTRS